MQKVDYRKQLKHLYNPSAKEPVVFEVAWMQFLQIDGEEQCAQIMHIGPYADEEPTIARLHEFIFDNGTIKNAHGMRRGNTTIKELYSCIFPSVLRSGYYRHPVVLWSAN